jgi:hypothetical protein
LFQSCIYEKKNRQARVGSFYSRKIQANNKQQLQTKYSKERKEVIPDIICFSVYFPCEQGERERLKRYGRCRGGDIARQHQIFLVERNSLRKKKGE